MRIKLINPSELDKDGNPYRFKRQFAPGLTLPYLAALIPGDHEFEIIEDSVETIDFEAPVDLVLITAMTSRAPRAYRIADEFRKRNVKVIMGGFHPTLCSDEAIEHCDAIVAGEAEGLFEEILDDLSKNALKRIYKRDTPHSMKDLPTPRYDLIKFDLYEGYFYPIQLSRGCPHRCSFCSVSKYHGATYRFRPLDDVIADAKKAGKFILFIDDNIAADMKYTRELFERLKPLNKSWGAQCTAHAAANEEFVRSAKEAGGTVLFIGFETFNEKALRSVTKPFNKPDTYKEAIKNLNKHNLSFMASLIIGFDEDDLDVFDNLSSFLESNKIQCLCLWILTPLPGTQIFAEFEKEGRLTTKDWSKYNLTTSVFTPKNFTSRELEEQYWKINRRFYSLPSMAKRLLNPLYFTWIAHNLMVRAKVRRGLHPLQGDPAGVFDFFLPQAFHFLTGSDFAHRMGDRLKKALK